MYGSHGKGIEDGGKSQLTAMKLERADVKLTSAATTACSGEDNDAEKSLPPRKVRQLLKRLLEGICPVRELMVARQNLTLIQSQFNAVVASLGWGDYDVLPPFQQVRSIRRGQAVQQPWRGLCKTLEPFRFMGQTREF